MNMGLSLTCRLELLAVSGGMTTTIFPEVERMLNETDYQKSLKFVASRKDMERYRSMVDFLFCEVFVKYQPACFRFYGDETKHPLLKEILTADEVERYGRWLVAALELARTRFEKSLEESWVKFRSEVLKLAA